jgi:hypothetical protein
MFDDDWQGNLKTSLLPHVSRTSFAQSLVATHSRYCIRRPEKARVKRSFGGVVLAVTDPWQVRSWAAATAVLKPNPSLTPCGG